MRPRFFRVQLLVDKAEVEKKSRNRLSFWSTSTNRLGVPFTRRSNRALSSRASIVYNYSTTADDRHCWYVDMELIWRTPAERLQPRDCMYAGDAGDQLI